MAAAYHVEPTSIPCPRCDAGIEEPCYRPNGTELKSPHVDRRKLADELAEGQRNRAEGDAQHRIDRPRWQRVYAACRLELEQRSGWTPLAAEQLESLVLNMAAAEDARAAARSKPTVEGSMGQQVANPAIAVALRYDGQALATANALKLTPHTRGTSAPPLDGAGEAPAEEDKPAEAQDELAEVDELAARRKAAAGKRRRR